MIENDDTDMTIKLKYSPNLDLIYFSLRLRG